MRILLIVGLILLGGCQTTAEQAESRRLATETADRQKCASFGFSLGSPQYGDCLLRLHESRARADQARKAAILQGWMARPVAPAYTPAPMTPSPAYRPMVNTYCSQIGGALHCQSQ